MLEIRVQVDNIDYEALIECLVPVIGDVLKEQGGIAALAGSNPMLLGNTAKLLLKLKGASGVEETISQLANKKEAVLSEKLEGFACEKGVCLHVNSIAVKSL